jgi:hypothetical protein
MPNILTEALTAFVSGSVSALDGRAHGVQQNVGISAYLGTLFEMYMKGLNCIHTASATLISGDSAGGIALGLPSTLGASAVRGLAQGWPFTITNIGISGQPGSAVSTTSTTIRKVLVGLTFSALSAVVSSLNANSAAMVFVVGSAYATSAGAVVSGGASGYFNSVPMPKPSAGLVPLGWLNIVNSCPGSGGISAGCMMIDWRVTQGLDLSAIQGTIYQP